MTGNPCESWPHFREYVIARVPQLKRLDGTDILKSERLKAQQVLELLQTELKKISLENIEKKRVTPPEENAYTREYRTNMYKELLQKRQEDEKEKAERHAKDDPMDDYEKWKRTKPAVYNDKGEIRQCNQGQYKFKFDDNWRQETFQFELAVPKYLDTSLLNVELYPKFVRVDVKDKITQIIFPEEIICEKSKIQRSTTTGALVITCHKANFIKKPYASTGKDIITRDIEEIKGKRVEKGKGFAPIKLAHLMKKGEKEEEIFLKVKGMIKKYIRKFRR